MGFRRVVTAVERERISETGGVRGRLVLVLVLVLLVGVMVMLGLLADEVEVEVDDVVLADAADVDAALQSDSDPCIYLLHCSVNIASNTIPAPPLPRQTLSAES
jgi:hypothetical protein